MKYPSYKTYKDSGINWVGEIPEHWEVLQLRKIIKKFVDYRGKTPEKVESGIPLITARNIKNGKIDLSLSQEYINAADYDKIMVRGLPEINDILLTTEAPLGECALIKDVEIALAQRIILLKANKAIIDNIFLMNFFLSNTGQRELTSRSTGSTAIGIKASHLKEIHVLIPQIQEQKVIASFLDHETAKIDAMIEKKRRLIELLEEKRTAIISHAVTKGLDPDSPMKDSGIEWLGQIPEHWEVKKFFSEVTVKARLGWRGLKSSEYVDDGYAFLSTPDIKDRHINYEDVNRISEYRYKESPEIMLKQNDVLLAKDGSTLGIVNVVRNLMEPTTVNSSIAVIRPKKNMNGVFLYYWIQSHYLKNTIENLKGGMGVPHLFQSDIRKFHALRPPMKEQEEIADYLDNETKQIEGLILKNRQVIEKLKEYRTALISAAVTGKIDVRGQNGQS